MVDKPYECSKCEYKSKIRGNLKAHEKTHSEERPWPCDICDFASKTKGDLIKHKRTHDKLKRRSLDTGGK